MTDAMEDGPKEPREVFHVVCSWMVGRSHFSHSSHRFTVDRLAWQAFHKEVERDHSGFKMTEGGVMATGPVTELRIDLVKTELTWIEGRASSRGADQVADSWTAEHGYRSEQPATIDLNVAASRIAALKALVTAAGKRPDDPVDKCRCGRDADRYDPDGVPYCTQHLPVAPAPVEAAGLF